MCWVQRGATSKLAGLLWSDSDSNSCWSQMTSSRTLLHPHHECSACSPGCSSGWLSLGKCCLGFASATVMHCLNAANAVKGGCFCHWCDRRFESRIQGWKAKEWPSGRFDSGLIFKPLVEASCTGWFLARFAAVTAHSCWHVRLESALSQSQPSLRLAHQTWHRRSARASLVSCLGCRSNLPRGLYCADRSL